MLTSKIVSRRCIKPATSLLVLLLSIVCTARAQLSVTLTAQFAAPNNCNQRVLTASVSGGSGNYTYFWTSSPSSGANLGNTPTITVSPTQTTTFTSGVFDMGTGQFATSSVTIGRIITGTFSVFIPNVITPNGDGFNDTWRVYDGNQGTGPLNSYQYSLTIVNRNGSSVMSSSGTVTTGTQGLVGGEIFWNGRNNNTGSFVSDGVYFFSVVLTNCSSSQNFNGSLTVIGSSGRLAVYPNPASNVLNIAVGAADRASLGSTQEIDEYEITLISKTGTPVLRKKSSSELTTLDISSLPKDTYFIKVDSQGEVTTRKLQIDP